MEPLPMLVQSVLIKEKFAGVEGTYTTANVEVDKYGRIIGVSNGTTQNIEKLDDIGDVTTPSPRTESGSRLEWY